MLGDGLVLVDWQRLPSGLLKSTYVVFGRTLPSSTETLFYIYPWRRESPVFEHLSLYLVVLPFHSLFFILILHTSTSMRSGILMRMSSQPTYIHGVIIFVLTILIFYTSLVTVVLPSYTFTPPMQQHGSKWKGWANIDTIISLCVCTHLPPSF